MCQHRKGQRTTMNEDKEKLRLDRNLIKKEKSLVNLKSLQVVV